MKTTWEFEERLRRGKEYEAILSNYFRQRCGCLVTPARPDEDLAGIDAWVTITPGRAPVSVQWKADEAAARTGNFFLEFDHKLRDGTHRPGWITTMTATVVVLYVPLKRAAYWLTAKRLGALFAERVAIDKRCEAYNKDYVTTGLCVSVGRVASVAEDCYLI